MRAKNKITILLCISIFLMTVGFAAFSTTLTITGTADIASTWKVVFSKIEQVSKTSGVAIKSAPTASETTATFNVGFTSPGDKIVYRVTIANQGTLNAVINEIKASESGSDAIIFELANINQGDILEAGDTTTFDVTIKYDENITSQPNIIDNQLTVTINYVQSVGQAITPSTPVIQIERLSAAIFRHNTPKSDANIDFGKTSEEDGTKGLYYTNKNTEDNKTTYYFRGAVENNYVKFGQKGVCEYNGELVFHALSLSSGTSLPTGDQCLSTPVCDAGSILQEQFKENYRYVTGIDSATCQYMGGTPTGENATYSVEDIIWRIIRINEDGSVRMITEEAVGSSAFNYYDNDNAYVGYMYGTPGSNSYEATHANNNDSAIKQFLDKWYSNSTNLLTLSDKIADSGFCNDRSLREGTGVGHADTGYGWGTNVIWGIDATTILYNFACKNASNDLFTLKGGNKGNKKLNYPVGLITVSEVQHAGAVNLKENKSFYLMNDNSYWTMQPFEFNDEAATNKTVLGLMFIGPTEVASQSSFLFVAGASNYTNRVRPVINLTANVQITGGNGTKNTPYVVSVG